MKKLLLGIGIFLMLLQFIPVKKNNMNEHSYGLETKYQVSEPVKEILANACNDCHSNQTTYPWYSNIQPVGFWLNHHVNEGKEHLNFSTFAKLPVAIQNHKLEEVMETVDEGEMPLPSYTYLGMHPKANLTEDQKNQLIDWAKAQMDTLKANYPADSLKLKSRKREKENDD